MICSGSSTAVLLEIGRCLVREGAPTAVRLAFFDGEEALVRWCALNQLRARPLRLVGYDEDEE